MAMRAEDPVVLLEARIAEVVGAQKFNVWFKNNTRFCIAGDYVHINTPNHFVGDWIERHFGEVIAEAAKEVTGREFSVSFATDPELARGLAPKQPDRQVDYVASQPERLARMPRRTDDGPGPRLKGQLDDFVVGPSNRLAFAAAQHVVDQPGNHYNPLFIHGGCGLGKKHLLQAVCNGLSQKHARLRWRYVSGEEFTNDYICAVKTRETEAFHARYRGVDVLVIDDVHFLANKKATQEEFLHTFKAIDVAGKQIVLASDSHPRLIGHFSESLVSRFLSGMVVRIEAPDQEVRLSVLRRRAQRLQSDVSDAVLMHIAEHFRANIRELEGALLKVIAQAQLMGQAVTLPLAERAVRDLVRQTEPVVFLSDIESTVAIFFGLSPTDLHTSRKSRTIALARGIAMYLARKHTAMSFPEIGRFMGNKNHSTVILACRRISKLIQDNEAARWSTPAGPRERQISELVDELEQQCCRKEAAA